jgi:hypothetical protein
MPTEISKSADSFEGMQAGPDAMVFRDDNWETRGGGRLLIYTGLPLQENLQQQLVQEFVRKKRAWGAMWTYGWNSASEGQWYRYICDIPDYDIEKIESKSTRKDIRRCLRQCAIKKIDLAWLAHNGYHTYINASRRYTHFVPLNKDRFEKNMLELAAKSGYEAWGVFRDEVLIAYAIAQMYADSVQLLVAKFDPEYAKVYPMYGLYYSISQCYLKERKYRQILGASRALLHETNIGDFRLKMGWHKVNCCLGLYLKWHVRLILFLAKLFRAPIKILTPARYYAILDSLVQAQNIAKATRAKLNHGARFDKAAF